MRIPARLAAPLLTAALLAATGCTATAEERSEALRIVGPFEVHSLDPATSQAFFTRLEVAETLVGADINGELVPGLATEWTHESHTTWTFELPHDAEFHDGTPVTGDAVAASLAKVADVEASPLSAIGIDAITGDEHSVRFELTEPFLTLPATLTHYSTMVLAPSSWDEDGHVTDVIGSGPYQVDHVEFPGSIEVSAYDGWRGEAPAIERLTFQSVSRPESRALMAASDQADIVFGLEPAGRQRVEAAPNVEMVSALQPRTLLLKVNGDHPVLGDPRVRLALSKALDRPGMATAVLREDDLAATQLIPPSLSAWHDEALEPLTQDLDGARDLLAEAGWEQQSDGSWQRDGETLRLSLVTYPDRAELPALATAIQAAFAELGIGLDVNVTNSSEIPAGHADGTLELGLLARHFALVSDPLVTVADTFAPEGSDWGAMNWHDDEVGAAITALLRGAEGAEGEEHRRTVVEAVHEELPLIPVAWYRMNAAVNSRVADFVMDPLEHTWRLSGASWQQ
ncbi:ABC transporter substrate-binding protein [Nocardioides limicola]|uniref:ABC transporter substrate-binding protein n=1 Tax=Nocardioides limicola TaxID=2803368 RepID=UPI00193B3C0F|nr:ABC transporter substrate-binding protein [Nocardioides sp. DJM-14]